MPALAMADMLSTTGQHQDKSTQARVKLAPVASALPNWSYPQQPTMNSHYPTTTKPALLLVHGAWHSSSSWSFLIPRLEAAGYEASTVALPSVSATKIQDDFSADMSTIASAITSLADQGRDVALIMHSYAGIPGSSAVKGLTKSERQRQGKQGGGGVTQLIYIAAFMLDEGVSLIDAVGGQQPGWQLPDWWVFQDEAKKSLMPAGPEERFYNDVSDPTLLDHLVKGLQPHAVGSFYSKNGYAAWRELPTTYIACAKDNAIPFDGQKAMMAIVRDALKEGGTDRHLREVVLDSDHSPMISMPERLAEEVRKSLEA